MGRYGTIHSHGFFGPWREDSPRGTPVRGNYSFSNADLATIRGIAGILKSTGQYSGALDQIVVDGATDTPDFHLETSDHSAPLHTEFHALVDGTTGDVYLRPVKATLLHSSLVAEGSVVRSKEAHGHHIELNVSIANGRIEDFLQVGVRTDPPCQRFGSFLAEVAA